MSVNIYKDNRLVPIAGTKLHSDTKIPEKISELENDAKFVAENEMNTYVDSHSQKVLKSYVKDTDYATYEKAGLLKLDRASGLRLDNNNIYIDSPNDTELKEKKTVNAPLKPQMIDKIVKYGLTDNQLDWTDEEKKSARDLLGALQRLPRALGYNGVYAFDTKGNDAVMYTYKEPLPNTLAQRNNKGCLAIAEAVNDNEATTKKYVDDSIANYGQLELINEVEISEEITALSISEDMNGEPFELRKAMLFYYYPKYEGSTEIPSWCFSELNGKTVGDYHARPNAYTQAFLMVSKNNVISGLWSIEQDLKNKIRAEKVLRDNNYDNKPDLFSGFGGNNMREWNVLNDEIGTITSIGFTGGLAFEGCKFILYGVRA